MKTLEQIIRQYVKLHRMNNKGWYPCVHLGCDHGRKGPRAAFRFHPEGAVEFNCFNCPPEHRHTGFDPNRNYTFPNTFKKVLRDFNIPDEEWKPIQLKFFSHKKTYDNQEDGNYLKNPKEIDLPKNFISLQSVDNDLSQLAKNYLMERKIDVNSYPFMISIGSRDKWSNRLIIPFYKNGNLIYYTGRDLTGKAKKKYENPLIEKENVIFNFDVLFSYDVKRVFICEGVLDALSIPDCVAINGNKMTKGQIEWLNSVNKEKVYIPDKIKGLDAAMQALELGWSVSLPNIPECKDINEGVKKYGYLFVVRSIFQNIKKGATAKISTRFYTSG